MPVVSRLAFTPIDEDPAMHRRRTTVRAALIATFGLLAAACASSSATVEEDDPAAAKTEEAEDDPSDGASADPRPASDGSLSPLCQSVARCCRDVEADSKNDKLGCDRLIEQLTAVGPDAAEPACHMFFDQLARKTAGMEDALPQSCKDSMPAASNAPTPTPAPQPVTGGAELCPQVRACCAGLAAKLPELADSCTQVDKAAATYPNQCGTLLQGLQTAARALEENGTPMPADCR